MQLIWTALTFLFSSSYVLLLDYFAYSSRGLQKSLVLPILILLILFYKAKVKSWKNFIEHQGKWFLLLWATILVQTLVIATGGLQSPFLILIHLGMISISFFFSFGAALIFLLFCFEVVLGDLSFNHTVLTYLLTNPSTFILQLVSLLSIIPIAYIISRQYHLKDVVSTMLRSKVAVDEAILESLDELIIVTDEQLNILSLNDAVEQTLQKPRSALIDTPLFHSLLLKDQQGKLATKETFFTQQGLRKEQKDTMESFSVINAGKATPKLNIQIQSIQDMHTTTKQYSFILHAVSDGYIQEQSAPMVIAKARAKYEAMMQALKQILQSSPAVMAYNPLLLVEKLENDLYNAQILASTPYKKTHTKIDIAMLCQKNVEVEQSFAKSFQVAVNFKIQNFGHEEIASLTVKNYPVQPENLTGPFFTIDCDVKNTEIVIKKLVDLAIFLASSTPNATVDVQIEQTKKNITIQVKIPNPKLKKSNLSDLFLPNYGKLADKTNVLAGSGLEGYLIKTVTEKMQTPVSVGFEKGESVLAFTWVLQRPLVVK